MSSKLSKSLARQQARAEQLQHWSETHRVDLEGLDEGQKWVVFLVLQLLAVIGTIPPLRRVLGYFLAHFGMDLGNTLIGVSDRAVRATRAQSATTFWEHLSQPARCPPPPPLKLGPEHAGPVAKYLVEHPRAKAPQILQFIAEELGVTMDRLTLRRYRARYGLGWGPADNLSAKAKGGHALRPDITNATLLELFEVKPAGALAQGQAEMTYYLSIFHGAGVPMKPGNPASPGTQGILPAPGGHFRFYAPVPGVIIYRYQHGDFVPVPQAQGQEQEQPVAEDSRAPAWWRHMEEVTGLTGVALLLYLLFSEGSRIVVPPRNFVPVP